MGVIDLGRQFSQGMEHRWELQLQLLTANTPETIPDGWANKKL